MNSIDTGATVNANWTRAILRKGTGSGRNTFESEGQAEALHERTMRTQYEAAWEWELEDDTTPGIRRSSISLVTGERNDPIPTGSGHPDPAA